VGYCSIETVGECVSMASRSVIIKFARAHRDNDHAPEQSGAEHGTQTWVMAAQVGLHNEKRQAESIPSRHYLA
jgi:hypothetical protein